jgi:hypothetical protein
MCAELEIEQEYLNKKGLRDVKIFWGENIQNFTKEQLCHKTAEILKAYRSGQYKKAGIIDRLLACKANDMDGREG